MGIFFYHIETEKTETETKMDTMQIQTNKMCEINSERKNEEKKKIDLLNELNEFTMYIYLT